MKIIVDAMGGDNAPAEIVKGTVEAVREYGIEAILVGRREQVEACLNSAGAGDVSDRISIVNATEVVEMEAEELRLP